MARLFGWFDFGTVRICMLKTFYPKIIIFYLSGLYLPLVVNNKNKFFIEITFNKKIRK